MIRNIEIPGTILLVDDKIDQIVDENNIKDFSLYDFNKILIKNGYNTILTEPDTVTMIKNQDNNFLKDISILITDLKLNGEGGIDETDIEQLNKMIERILKERNRLLVIYLSTLLDKDKEKNEDLTKDIEENFKNKSKKIKFIGHIPKKVFLNKTDEQIIKIFNKILNDFLNKDEILDSILMHYWECLIRNSIDLTIDRLYSSGNNSIDRICSSISKLYISPNETKSKKQIKDLILSLKINDLFCSILSIQMKNQIENLLLGRDFITTINRIIKTLDSEVQNITIIQNSTELTPAEINNLIQSTESLIRNKNYLKAIDQCNQILNAEGNNQKAMEFKENIINEMNKNNDEIIIWKDNIKSLLNFRILPNDLSFADFPLFSGLIFSNLPINEGLNNSQVSYLVITPKCDVYSQKTNFMICVKVITNILMSDDVRINFVSYDSYYNDILNELKIVDLNKRKNLQDRLLNKNSLNDHDRFYTFEYINNNIKKKRIGLIDFSQVLSISHIEFNSKKYKPYMIVEDEFLNDIKIQYVKYINRFGLFDF